MDGGIEERVEKVGEWLEQWMCKKFTQVTCSSRVSGTGLRLFVYVSKDDPQFDEVKKVCSELEDTISYPQLSIALCPPK